MKEIITRTVSDAVGSLDYTLERKSVKNINLRIKKDGSVAVSANRRTALLQIDNFVRSKLAFIRAAQQKLAQRAQRYPGPRRYITGETYRMAGQEYQLLVKKGKPETVCLQDRYIVLQLEQIENAAKRERLFKQWWEQQCKKVFGDIMEQIQPLFSRWNVEMPLLKLRDMTSRWGSCMPAKRTITLNKRLLSAPLPCIEYVILHEFCHFIHPDHSARFWGLVASFMPDWKARRYWLEQTAEF